MVKIQYKNAEVEFKVKTKDNGKRKIIFYNPDTQRYTKHLNLLIKDDDKPLLELIQFIGVLKWDEFLSDVTHDDDVFKMIVTPMDNLPLEGVGLEKVKND